MWCLLFLKSYATESIIAVTVQADEKTVRKWVWYLITELGDLYDDLVSEKEGASTADLDIIISHILSSCLDQMGQQIHWTSRRGMHGYC